MAAACITPTGAFEARALTLVEVGNLGLIWRLSCQNVGMSGEGAHARFSKGVKLDQTEEIEVLELTPDASDQLLKNQVPETEPTEDQAAALQLCVIGRGGTPYADVAVLTPYFKLHNDPGHGFRSQMEVARRLSSQASLLACLQGRASVPEVPSWGTSSRRGTSVWSSQSVLWTSTVRHSVRYARSFQRRGTWPSQPTTGAWRSTSQGSGAPLRTPKSRASFQ